MSEDNIRDNYKKLGLWPDTHTPSPLAFPVDTARGDASCEEKLRACEIQLMLNKADAEQVKQFKAIAEQSDQDFKAAQNKIQSLQNEIKHLREHDVRVQHVMEEVHSLTEHLDFKLETKRLKFIVLNNEICYLRFDRNGDCIKAYAPEEYERAQTKEWEEINKQ